MVVLEAVAVLGALECRRPWQCCIGVPKAVAVLWVVALVKAMAILEAV